MSSSNAINRISSAFITLFSPARPQSAVARPGTVHPSSTPAWPRSPRNDPRTRTLPRRLHARRVHRTRERARTRDIIHIHASHARSRVDHARRRRRAAARMRHGRDPDPRDRSDDVRRRLATRARRRRREQRAGRTLGMSFFRFARSLARTPCFLCLRRRRETDERRRDGERTTETFKTDLLGWTRRERVASRERC